MSTWQLFYDAGNQTVNEIAAPTQQPRRLPSVSALLRKGYLKINEGKNVEKKSGYPMFRTGSGKPVVIKQSSVSEASVILGDLFSDQECSSIMNHGADGKVPPMLHTRSENSQVINQPSQSKTLRTIGGCPKFRGYGAGRLKSPSLFRNGYNKQSPLSKTSSISSEIVDDSLDTGQVSEGNGVFNFANSMFQTGSGKAVNISTSGLARAKQLLGLEDNQTHQALEETMQQVHAQDSNQQSSHLSMKIGVADKQEKNSSLSLVTPLKVWCGTSGSELLEVTPESVSSISKSSSVKFHTAGGRSISVSSDALQRARSLLGDIELGSSLNEGDEGEPVFSIFKDKKVVENSNKLNGSDTCVSDQHSVTRKPVSKNFISPLRSTSLQKQSRVTVGLEKNLIENFDAEVHESTGYNNANFTSTGLKSEQRKNPPDWPLVNTSKTVDMGDRSNKKPAAVKRMLTRGIPVTAFKRPRISKFITPLTNEIPLVNNGSLILASEESSSKKKVSNRYPFLAPRKYVKEYFGVPPRAIMTVEHLPEWIRVMNPYRAEEHCFPGGFGFDSIGKEAFYHMLLQSGASMKYVSATWVSNHYKWIVWKLACYERYYPGRYLTVHNVMEELKYRYEREINHGHRSSIKKICEGDAPPSSVLVLCISCIQSNAEAMSEKISTSHGVNSSTTAIVELTDGWYPINAVLDAPLSKKLISRKMFVGQKLKISGAGLCGWAGPVSPLEASSTVSLVLHINGTYRTHWADRLGFCNRGAAPLAFNSIKSGGGAVPVTYVGIQRIYPVLYRERLSSGEYYTRSERMEAKMLESYNQRRSDVVEGVMSELHKVATDINIHSDSDDSEEVAKILKILEASAEPDILMADMSVEQLKSLSVYQEKLEATRQSNMHKSIEKALEDSGLSRRDVTPFLRLSVVGLTTKSGKKNHHSRKGLITIWNPTEQQRLELLEGQACAVLGLVAGSSNSDILYLQARGSTTKWLQLSPSTIQLFQPFYNPRKPISLYKFNDVPLNSEFDITGHVVFVGEVYTAARQRKQWVFVTDRSVNEPHFKTPSNNILAICFCEPSIGQDSSAPFSYNLAGSTVGFCNIIKRENDRVNHIWVAEATENSEYSSTYEHKQYIHLKDAALGSQKWAKVSSLTIERLKRKVLSIIGNCKLEGRF